MENVVKTALTQYSIECSICMEQIDNKNDEIITPCSHHFHSKCLIKWTMQKNSCPNCRQQDVMVCQTKKPNLLIYNDISISSFYHIFEYS